MLSKERYDSRDYIYQVPDKIGELPAYVDHRQYAGAIENQGLTNSCVANATVSALEILLQKAGAFVDLSRLFLYYNLREPYPELNGQDSGAYLCDAFNSVHHKGICPETTWPFNVASVNNQPTPQAYTEALNRICTRYERVVGWGQGDLNNASILKYVIARGYPLAVSMKIGASLFSISGPLASQNYIGSSPDFVGGHAMCVVGYDDSIQSFIVENSWGPAWGDNGYCAIKYQVMVNDLQDCWVCTEFAGFVFEDEFQKEIIPMTTETVNTTFHFDQNKMDYNKYCLASVTGGKPPYTYEFKDPAGPGLRERSSDPFFYKNVVIPTSVNFSHENHIVCVIRDSDEPYQKVTQPFITYCSVDPVPITKTYDSVTALYVAYFNRVPDLEGIEYWINTSILNSIIDISESFYTIAISVGIYPTNLSSADFITMLYSHLFNRNPDQEGLLYWTQKLDSGEISRGALTVYLITSAWGPSKLYLDNKIFVGRTLSRQNKTYDLSLVTDSLESVRTAISQ